MMYVKLDESLSDILAIKSHYPEPRILCYKWEPKDDIMKKYTFVLSIVLQQYLRIYISFFLTSWHKLAICYNSFANCKKCNKKKKYSSQAS